MKKVLILSYFFPPANLAGSYRIASWAKHLHKFGYYPVIVTRCWNDNQTETTDIVINNDFSHEKFENYEVYRLPYHLNLRDRLHQKYGEKRLKLIRKFLTFLELFFQHYTSKIIPYKNLYDFSRELIKKDGDFKVLIASGRPYQVFKFADMLHRETGIRWIADYRDEWNTHQWFLDENFYARLIRMIESRSEKKWLKSATLFTTCSENWVEHIGSFINRPGRVLLNGYEDNLIGNFTHKPQSDTLKIVHNGTVFTSQVIETFLNGYKKFLNEFPSSRIILLFPGVDNNIEQGNRIRNILKGYERYFSTSPRIPKAELIKTLESADLFLMIGTHGVKGHHSSKIFEYLALNRPIILSPDDKDVMSELIHETNSGFILDTEEDVRDFLRRTYKDFSQRKPIHFFPKPEKVALYSREKQAQILAGIFDEIDETSVSTYTITDNLSEKQTADIIELYYSMDVVSIEQYPGFAQANTNSKIYNYIQTNREGKITAYAQIEIQQFLIARVFFGPLATSSDAYRESLLHIKSYCTRQLIPIIRVSPPHFTLGFGARYFDELHKEVNFETSDKFINWSTLILPIDSSEEDIFKNFANNHKQSLKKAIKLGLTAHIVADQNTIDKFSAQHCAMYKARGFRIDPQKNQAHFRKLFDFFKNTGLGYFIVIKEEESILGGICCSIQGNTSRYLEGYSHPDYRKYPISHLAIFEAIKIAKNQGLQYFDFGGFANNVKEGDQLYGVNKFKEAFRGALIDYPKTMVIYNFPLAKWLYSLRKR